MGDCNPEIDPRQGEMIEWLRTLGLLDGSELRPASRDASFRRYFRLQSPTRSFIVMDAPPAQEDCSQFIRVAGYLEAMRLNAPRVLEANTEQGFLLLTDLGSTQYFVELVRDASLADPLYNDALRALRGLQDKGGAYQSLLPPYGAELLRFELSLFHDWLCETHLSFEFSSSDEDAWQAACDLLVANALDQPQVFVHRDYHARNLMRTPEDNPGILDFQDAVEGPYTYDLVSLLKDCYLRWPPGEVRCRALDFFSRLDDTSRGSEDESSFMRHFELMGVQRHLKAAGIFARLFHRDGKPGYLADIPRTLNYIVEIAPRYGELGFLSELIEAFCLPAMESKR